MDGRWRGPGEDPEVGRALCDSRGLTHGLGLFETLRVHRGKPLFFDLHFERFERGARDLAIPVPLVQDALQEAALSWIERDRIREGRLRYSLWAGTPGGEGAYWEESSSSILALELHELSPDTPLFPGQPLRLQARTGWRHRAPPYKPISYLPYLLARREASSRGYDDSCLIDPEGRILQISSGNLIWEREGRLETSPGTIVVPGTVRRLFVESRGGPPVVKGVLTIGRLGSVTGIWACNSFLGVAPVQSIGELWEGNSPGAPGHELLRGWYRKMVEEDVQGPGQRTKETRQWRK